MIENHSIVGVILILLRMFHKILYYVEAYVKSFSLSFWDRRRIFYVCSFQEDRPAYFHEALSSVNINDWMFGMRGEMNSMKKN